MKLKLLAVVALLATTISTYAMQKSFNYETYKFNIPAQGLKVGDMFTVTNVDPFASSRETLKDATGKDWAKKLSSVYPGGKTRPGKGTATFKVVAIPLTKRAPEAQPQAPKAQQIPRKPAAAPQHSMPSISPEIVAAYNTLGLKPGANEETVREAYKALARKWHPDKNPNNPAATGKFKEISAAYEFLTKPQEEIILED